MGTKAKWKVEYTYDDGDNLLTKKTPVQENFDDLVDNGWNGDASYVATKGYLEKESGTIDAGNCMAQAEADFQIWFSYQHNGTSDAQVHLREHWAGQVIFKITATDLELWEDDGVTALDTSTEDSTAGVWYECYARLDGGDVEIWRREKGTTDDLVKVLETSSVTMTSNAFLTYASGTGKYLDDIVVLALNGDTLEEETFAYNAGNEMTAQVVDGNTINYTYDQFGRMTKKTRGGYSANYYYHYGDKLTKVASNFWGEGTVTYTYGGDQKRRSRAVSGGETIKYRYDKGWSVLNEENGSGTLEATYFHQPGRQIGTVLATSAGSAASTGTWNYYFQDAIGSTRGLWDDSGDRLGKYEYSPFGGKYADHGENITRKFTGHDWDSEARLYCTAYRYYSPGANRWLTRDPLGMVDGPNVYAYVVNNPVNIVDALGKCGTSPNPLTPPTGDDGEIGEGDFWGLAASVVFAVLAILAVAAFALKIENSQWRNSSVAVSLNHCIAALIVLASSVVAAHMISGQSTATWAIIGAVGFAAGAACIGLWAIRALVPATISVTGIHAMLALVFGDTALGFAIAGGGTTVAVTGATYRLWNLLTR